MPQYVVIIGAGRSGSSILHELIGHHPRVGWMSRLCESHPFAPQRNRRALQAMRLPLVGGLFRRKYAPQECYRFFDAAYPGFSAPARDLVRRDLTDAAAHSIRTRLEAVTPSHRDTLFLKITGWPRIGFLDALFPGARFVHLVRDGRAVANSLLQVPWWHGWRGPENWRFGPLPLHYAEEWESHDRSFVALAAIEWKLIMDAVCAARNEVDSEQILNVRYEDLCAQPREMMSRIVAHAGLVDSPKLYEAMRRDPLSSRNSKWREDLGPENAAIVDAVLADALHEHGYQV